jgi:hypothetical protein
VVCTLLDRSANSVGVASSRPSKTWTYPPFSATNTRPSGENLTAVGRVSPLRTTSSWKRAGRRLAAAGVAGPSVAATTTHDSAIPWAILRPALGATQPA